jgi:hypothetical protein
MGFGNIVSQTRHPQETAALRHLRDILSIRATSMEEQPQAVEYSAVAIFQAIVRWLLTWSIATFCAASVRARLRAAPQGGGLNGQGSVG